MAQENVTNQIAGIGIGAPNGNYFNGTIRFAPNLPWKGVIPLAQMVREKFNIPVTITNDANAAAIGEMTYGAARGVKDFIMITLGTVVGSGIVINGQMVYGHDGFAGELGHVIARQEMAASAVAAERVVSKPIPPPQVLRVRLGNSSNFATTNPLYGSFPFKRSLRKMFTMRPCQATNYLRRFSSIPVQS